MDGEESLRVLARCYGINQKAVAKWKKRSSTADLPTGAKDSRSISLTIKEEAVVVASDDLHGKATRCVAADFLRRCAAAPLYKIHTVLTDNGVHFTDPTGDGWTPEDIKAMRAQKLPLWCHAFKAACADLDVEHRLTKPRHPWTNGQVERMNRTIKEATVERCHYETHERLRQHLGDFVASTPSLPGSRPCVGSPPASHLHGLAKITQSLHVNPHHQSPVRNT